jgi:16S rRNA (guanine966-N2)-methyltransferase
MTRIVAGRARGRQLAVPAKGTRPTSDRAREGLFNTLAGLVDLTDARVADLFAGTGAVGLEALSRGAGQVTLVESDKYVSSILKRNVDAVGLPGAVVLHSTVESFLIAVGADAPFDLIFADPPYALGDAPLAGLLQSISDVRWAAPGALVVIERPARGEGPRWPDVIEPLKHRRYGEGVLWYGRRR